MRFGIPAAGIRGTREDAKVILIALGNFLDAVSANFPPYPCDTFCPFQDIYETNGTLLLQGERVLETKDGDCRLHPRGDGWRLVGHEDEERGCKPL
jgi:hypothetical protein